MDLHIFDNRLNDLKFEMYTVNNELDNVQIGLNILQIDQVQLQNVGLTSK